MLKRESHCYALTQLRVIHVGVFWKGKRFLRRKVSNPIFSDCWVCGHQAWGFRNFWIDVKQNAKGEREWKNKTNGKNRTDRKEKRKRTGEKSVANEKEKLSFTIEFRTARKVVFVELADGIWVEREQESLSLRKIRSEDRTTFGKRERTDDFAKRKKKNSLITQTHDCTPNDQGKERLFSTKSIFQSLEWRKLSYVPPGCTVGLEKPKCSIWIEARTVDTKPYRHTAAARLKTNL